MVELKALFRCVALTLSFLPRCQLRWSSTEMNSWPPVWPLSYPFHMTSSHLMSEPTSPRCRWARHSWGSWSLRNVAASAALTCQNPYPHPPPTSRVVGPSWGGFSAPSLQPTWFRQRKDLSFKKPSLSTKFLVFMTSFILMYRWLLNWAWAMLHWQKLAWMPWKNGQFISANM